LGPEAHKGNILDLALTNGQDRILEISQEGRLGRSDHTIILVTLDVSTKERVAPPRPNWRRANWDAIRDTLRKTDWDSMLADKTTDQAWTNFRQTLDNTVKIHVPLTVNSSNNRPVWMSQALLREIRKKRRLWKVHTRRESRESFLEYKRQEKKVHKLIRNEKKKFERKLASEKTKNSRPFYSYLKQKTRNRVTVGPLLDENGSMVEDDGKMAEILNQYFSTVFTREETTNIPRSRRRPVRHPWTDIPFIKRVIEKKIAKLKTASSPGPDGITARLLQETAREVAGPLARIFKLSMDNSEVPKDWRDANVTPIFKKGTKGKASNYRPISLTSICSKLMESLLKDHMTHHLEKNGLINKSQHGFMPRKSCLTNLLEFFEMVTKNVDDGKPVDIIYLDFAKAFDKVPKERLLEKLRAHGFGDKIVNWIQSWLTNRRQRVVLNGKKSSWQEVLSGVPQGSVLGPLLFLIFINDLDDETTLLKLVKKFADDTKLAHPITGQEDKQAVQNTLDRLVAWASKWGMCFNVDKCKIMHVGRNNPNHTYSMNGQNLGETNSERDVGVTTTPTLKPSAQCAKAAQTAAGVLSQISRAFHYRDRKTWIGLYKTYVRPHLEYAVQAWSP